jgi:uncharacterized protein YukE
MTKGDLHEYADTNHSERNALRQEIERLAAICHGRDKALNEYAGEVDQLQAKLATASHNARHYSDKCCKYEDALEQIAKHLKLPCDKRDDGVLEQIIADAMVIAT